MNKIGGLKSRWTVPFRFFILLMKYFFYIKEQTFILIILTLNISFSIVPLYTVLSSVCFTLLYYECPAVKETAGDN